LSKADGTCGNSRWSRADWLRFDGTKAGSGKSNLNRNIADRSRRSLLFLLIVFLFRLRHSKFRHITLPLDTCGLENFHNLVPVVFFAAKQQGPLLEGIISLVPQHSEMLE
jgi:hypothetical protein